MRWTFSSHNGEQVVQGDILPVVLGRRADRPFNIELGVPVLDLLDQPKILGDELERVARVHFEVDDQGNTTTTLLPAPTDTNDIIRKGTQFTLILRKPVSNTLALTIKPPMTAVNEIAERVDASVREDGCSGSPAV